MSKIQEWLAASRDNVSVWSYMYRTKVTTDATSGAGTAYPPVFSGVRVTGSLFLCVCLCRSLFVLLYFFFLVIVLPVLRYTDFDYPSGTFKLF